MRLNPFARSKTSDAQATTYRYSGFMPLLPNFEANVPEVTEISVMGIPAAWRAIDLLTQTVGNMPLHGYKNDQRLKITPTVLERPNMLETRQETIASLVYSLIMRGNAYLYLGGWNELMLPTMFEVLNPDAVSVDTSTGEPLYRIGSSEPLTRFEVVHVRYLKLPGSVYGIGPVTACRLGIQNVLALEEYGRRSWGDNAVPSAVITVDDPALTPEQANEIKARWVANHGGSTKTPSVLGANMTVTPLSFSPQDAEYLSSKVHGIVEVANIFGIPATRLGAPGATSTYFNAAQDDLHFMKYTIQNWLIRIESALNNMLPFGTEAKFCPDHLLRGSTQDRYAAHKLALDAGWITVNEVRQIEDLEPLDGGDTLKGSMAPPALAPPDPSVTQDEGL